MHRLLFIAFTASAAAIHAPDNRRTAVRRAISPTELVAAKKVDKPPNFLQAAYSAAGLATRQSEAVS